MKLGEEDEEEELTSVKISEKIVGIINDGLVDVEPKPKKTFDEEIEDDGTVRNRGKNAQLTTLVKKMTHRE